MWVALYLIGLIKQVTEKSIMKRAMLNNSSIDQALLWPQTDL